MTRQEFPQYNDPGDPVAQLDRANGFEPLGSEFKSRRGRHLFGPYKAVAGLTTGCDEGNMNKQRHFSLHVLLLLGIFSGYLPFGFAQVSSSTTSDIVKRTMAAALAHCHSKTSDGIEAFTFIPPSNDEIETIKSLGSAAVEPLSTYVQVKVDCGFAPLFALKFLTALRNPAALGAFQRAFAQDQWEVTRMYALAGMFETSKTAAEPYVKAALEDKLPNVRHMAEGLWLSYQPHKSDK